MSAEIDVYQKSEEVLPESNLQNNIEQYNQIQEYLNENDGGEDKQEENEENSPKLQEAPLDEQISQQHDDISNIQNNSTEPQSEVQKTPRKSAKPKKQLFKSRITEDMLPKPPPHPPKKPKYVPDRSVDEKFRRARREAAALEQRREEQKRLLSEHQKRLQLNDQREEEEKENQKLSELHRRRQEMLKAVQLRKEARENLENKIKDAAEAPDAGQVQQLMKDVAEERRRRDPGEARKLELQKRAEWAKNIDARILYGIFASPNAEEGENQGDKETKNDEKKTPRSNKKQLASPDTQKSPQQPKQVSKQPQKQQKQQETNDQNVPKLPQLKSAVKAKIK